jgi:hypothetical protein
VWYRYGAPYCSNSKISLHWLFKPLLSFCCFLSLFLLSQDWKTWTACVHISPGYSNFVPRTSCKVMQTTACFNIENLLVVLLFWICFRSVDIFIKNKIFMISWLIGTPGTEICLKLFFCLSFLIKTFNIRTQQKFLKSLRWCLTIWKYCSFCLCSINNYVEFKVLRVCCWLWIDLQGFHNRSWFDSILHEWD